MKRLKKLLMMLMLFPVFGMMAIPDDGGSDSGGSDGDKSKDSGDENKDKKDSDSDGDKKNKDDKKDSQNEEKKFTQKDVDKIVKDRLARERKKANDDSNKDKDTNTDISADKDSKDSSGEGDKAQDNEVQMKLETAKAAVLMSTAQIEASKLDIDPNYISQVVKLADLSEIEIGDDMQPDVSAISKAIEQVLKDTPVFKRTENNSGGFKVGGSGNNTNENLWGNKGKGKDTNNNQQVRRWNKFNS